MTNKDSLLDLILKVFLLQFKEGKICDKRGRKTMQKEKKNNL
jgi:hypothetical protein